jgi:CBS-domain-containing membrane protein
MLHFMVDHKLESSPITTADGRLVGLLLQTDVAEAMRKEVQEAEKK